MMPSNRGVDRYRSPVSGSIARITDPADASLATFRAAAKVPPEDVPQRLVGLVEIDRVQPPASEHLVKEQRAPERQERRYGMPLRTYAEGEVIPLAVLN